MGFKKVSISHVLVQCHSSSLATGALSFLKSELGSKCVCVFNMGTDAGTPVFIPICKSR